VAAVALFVAVAAVAAAPVAALAPPAVAKLALSAAVPLAMATPKAASPAPARATPCVTTGVATVTSCWVAAALLLIKGGTAAANPTTAPFKAVAALTTPKLSSTMVGFLLTIADKTPIQPDGNQTDDHDQNNQVDIHSELPPY
jgi:hypothetical protein